MSRRFAYPVALVALACAAPAQAGLSEPVRAMIEAAIATGDTAKVATVVELARQTNPDDAGEIDALHRAFLDRQAELAAAEARTREQAIRTAGVFQRWSGKGEIGAYRSSGSSDNVGVTASLNLERKGIDWTHRLRGRYPLRATGSTGKSTRYRSGTRKRNATGFRSSARPMNSA
jgi:putative salt-induced outer membrane protein